MGQLGPESFALQDEILTNPKIVGDSFTKSFGEVANPLVEVKEAMARLFAEFDGQVSE